MVETPFEYERFFSVKKPPTRTRNPPTPSASSISSGNRARIGTPAANLSNAIAHAYLKGDGVPVDFLKAGKHYIKGMLQTDETAQTELASLLRVLREHGE